ncbi:hypothetical protein M1116_04215 [Patescibacteria group bacterium]|nr:hypothetical protein [Patescibacteria group bacterium]
MSANLPEINVILSGSFKFKDKIDAARAEFEHYGASVLAPDPGWSASRDPHLQIKAGEPGSHPLPTEIDLSIRQIEDTFLVAISRADLFYLVNPDGYLGNSAAFEVGFALACRRPLYAAEPLSRFVNIPQNIRNQITILPPLETLEHFRARRLS